MQSPVNIITEKLLETLRSMVCMAMRVSYRRGATVGEISSFLDHWAPAGDDRYSEGVVEQVLMGLHRDGKVELAGARWYPTGLAH